MNYKLVSFLESVLGRGVFEQISASVLYLPGEDVPILAPCHRWECQDGRTFQIAHLGRFVEVTGPRGFVFEMWVD